MDEDNTTTLPPAFQPLPPAGALARELAQLLRDERLLITPGVFAPVIALLAREAGFRCLYFSGAAFSALLGLPDLGLFTLSELVTAVRQIVAASRLPLIVDADTGFGGALNVARTVRELEEAGAAAIQIEDQENPKRCGHLEGKRLIPPDAMVEKIHAARRARHSLLIVARTDARAIEGLDGAIERARLYRAAGADIIFPEALLSRDEFATFAQAVGGPLLANMTEFGKSPLIPADELAALGYQIVIYPVSALRVALQAVHHFFTALAQRGDQQAWITHMFTRSELYQLIAYDAYERFDRQLAEEAHHGARNV